MKILRLLALSVLWQSAIGQSRNYDPLSTDQIPAQPSKQSWHFVEDLKSPFWTKIEWENKKRGRNQVDLSKGIKLDTLFPDSKFRLQTVYEDLRNFCLAGKIAYGSGYRVKIVKDPALKGEEFRVDIARKSGQIAAGDPDGIRRGIFYLQDEMMKNGDPYLPLGSVTKVPTVKRRISRCFFSPIKRPGNQAGVGDELMDDIDYYPDGYLNRLSHEGVNGLWVTVSSKDGQENSVGFSDLVSTEITPNAGAGGERRLEKLRQIVNKCLRYGIRIYIKTMEPHVRFKEGDPILAKYPDLTGSLRGNTYFLCASGTSGQKYLYQATNKIFSAVPELGGIINISHGELYTTCLSALPATGGGEITCPRCSKLPPWQILHHSLSAMNKGMKDAEPDAELISWLYMPQPQSQSKGAPTTLADWVFDIPSNTPEGVVLQFNFESGVKKTVFGKELIGGDYWLSEPGPSDRFERIAKSAAGKHTPVSAKIQTSTSHEVATVPYLPVPSLIYKKFSAMRRLGVSHTMLSWIMGSYPGLMVKATERLSFEPYPDEEAFLNELASYYWRTEDAKKVVEAWKYFSEAYENYPLTNIFQYFGPMHDGPVWPLLLTPRDAPLSPTYQLGSRNTFLPWPPSGDRVPESFPDILSLEEMISMCKRMSDTWQVGLGLLDGFSEKYSGNRERVLDIGVAKALGIQFRSGYNILRFYQLREKLFRMKGEGRRLVLDELKEIIEEEIKSGGELVRLCRADSRLGFHPEAEGYKYYPEKLEWRINQLITTLAQDVPAIRKAIDRNEALFPEYTGESPQGAVAYALPISSSDPSGFWNRFEGEAAGSLRWKADYKDETLHIMIADFSKKGIGEKAASVKSAEVWVEPKRLWPARRYLMTPVSKASISTEIADGTLKAEVKIPFSELELKTGSLTPVRVNIKAFSEDGKTIVWREEHPLTPRLILGTQNSRDLGWLIFK
ncbi:hypothetical protein [Ravibacter arvi]|uniref:hypothetical protein n=1 Tax=Ravibacter arvi TaxID=2051041 RepID=UPI0031F043A2